jgi:hypothetical protein
VTVLWLTLALVATTPTGAPAAADDHQADEGQLANFRLQRGWYVGADFGTFFTIGDTKGISNVQPYLALRLGYDLTDNFSLQLTGSAGYVSNNPLSVYDEPDKTPNGTSVTSYDLLNLTAEAVYALRVTSRFAIEPKAGIGVSRINPLPTDPKNSGVLLRRENLVIVGGVNFNYLTLLTDFSAGISANAYVLPSPGIVGLGLAVTLRYTF